MGRDDRKSAKSIEDIRPVVSESNGEISMSLEETNRVRAMLGLKPLNVGPSKEDREAENHRRHLAEQAQQKEQADVELRLENAKRRRLLHQKVGGPTLAEVTAGEEDLLSAADWVRQSRTKMAALEQEKVKGEKRKRALEEKDRSDAYTRDDLSGMRVAHGLDAFEAGESEILTLKDADILETDDHGVVRGLADGEDELESVAMAEVRRRQEAKDREKRARQGAYQAFDDAEFEEGAGVGPGAQRKILSHYDEEETIKRKRAKGVVRLGAGGELASDGSTPVASSAAPRIPVSLQVETKQNADYYTTEEMESFKKPSKKLRRKKPRSRAKEEEEEEEKAAASVDVAAAARSRDHGSRAARQAANGASDDGVAKAAEGGELDKKDRYDNAVSRAAEKARLALKTEEKLVNMPPPPPPVQEDDADDDLRLSLERARRLAQLKSKVGSRRNVEEEVRERVKKAAAAASSGGDSSAAAGDDMVVVKQEEVDGAEKDGAASGLVFTSASEFTSRLQAVLKEKAANREAARAGAASVKPAKKESAKVSVDETGGSTSASGGATMGTFKEEVLQDSDVEDEMHEAQMMRQPLVSSSVAAALSLLQASGEIKQKVHLAGRAKDLREFQGEAEDQEGGVKIEYRDEFGRQLTRAEAFRQLNYKFHGHGPGKNKLNKRLKILEEERARERKDQGISTTMGALRQVQQATAKPFVVLSGGSSSALPPPVLDLSKGVGEKKAAKR